MRIFGVTLPLLPVFSLATGGDGGGISGFLVPNISFSQRRGLEIALPYYKRLGPNRDLTVTPHVYTGVLPALEATIPRAQPDRGVPGRRPRYLRTDRAPDRARRGREDRATRASAPTSRPTARPSSTRCGASPARSASPPTRRSRAATTSRRTIACEASSMPSGSAPTAISRSPAGHSRACASTMSRSASRLHCPRSTPASGWSRRRSAERWNSRRNSLAILRIEGQDTQRAFASARWDLRRLTNWGQEVTFTGYARGDVYHTQEFGEHRSPILSRRPTAGTRAASERSRPT